MEVAVSPVLTVHVYTRTCILQRHFVYNLKFSWKLFTSTCISSFKYKKMWACFF